MTDRTVAECLEAATARLRLSRRIWVGTHLDPDGDAIGSALGLALGLERLGKTVTVSCPDPAPDEAAWLPTADRLTDQPPARGELAVAIDVAEPGRLGRLYAVDAWPGTDSLVVDHHVTNPGFGTINVIDPERSSTAEIVLDLLEALTAPIDADVATCLLTGLVTDTLGFRTSSTNARTFDAAQRLLASGARLGEVTQQAFYRRSLASLKLTAIALDRLEISGPFACSWLERRDLDATGARPEAARGVTGLLASAAEPEVIALLRENANGEIDVSLRSKPGVNLVPAAAALGGGGHPQAAGARLVGPMSEARAKVLQALHEHVELPDPGAGRSRRA